MSLVGLRLTPDRSWPLLTCLPWIFLFVVCLAIVFVRIHLFLSVGQYAAPFDDEIAYIKQGSAVAKFLSERLSPAETADALIGRGWFMPGPGLIAAIPISLRGALFEIRSWILGVNTTLSLLLIAVVAARSGPRIACLVGLSFLILVPLSLFACFVLGEMVGSQLAMLAGLIACSARAFRGKAAITGAIWLAAIYSRPSLALVFLGFPAVILALRAREAKSLRSLFLTTARSYFPMLLIVALGIAPWAHAVSTKFGGTYITTTSFAHNAVIRFGPDLLDEELKTHPNLHYALHDYAINRAKDEHRSYHSVMQELKNTALANLTPARYLAAVSANVRRALASEQFYERLYRAIDNRTRNLHKKSEALARVDAVSRMHTVLMLVVWPASLMLCMFNFRWQRRQPLLVLFRGLVLLLLIQTLLSSVNPRHVFLLLAPLTVLLGTLSWQSGQTACTRSGERAHWLIYWGSSFFTAALVATVTVAAIA